MLFPTLKEMLNHTTSRCPTCLAAFPAEVWKTTASPAKTYLTRNCAEHGETTACIAQRCADLLAGQGRSYERLRCRLRVCCWS